MNVPRICSYPSETRSEAALSGAGIITSETARQVPSDHRDSQTYLEALHPNANIWYVASRMETGVMAAALVCRLEEGAEIEEIAVRGDLQRQGLGRLLVHHIARGAEARQGHMLAMRVTSPAFAVGLGFPYTQRGHYAKASTKQILEFQKSRR